MASAFVVAVASVDVHPEAIIDPASLVGLTAAYCKTGELPDIKIRRKSNGRYDIVGRVEPFFVAHVLGLPTIGVSDVLS